MERDLLSVVSDVFDDKPLATTFADMATEVLNGWVVTGHPAAIQEWLDRRQAPGAADPSPLVAADAGPQTGALVAGLFDEAKHPRDRTGKFLGKGLPDGAAPAGPDGAAAMSEQDALDRQERVAKVIAAAVPTRSTDRVYAPDGAWDPDRDRLHRQIAADLYAAAAHVPTDGKAVIAGGLGGSGKSTVLRKYAGVDPADYLTLNPDDVKEEMARRGLIPDLTDAPDLSPMERVALVHEESSRITHLLADLAYRDRRNVIWDVTMSSLPSTRNRIDALHRHGYQVQGVFVDIPVEVSVARALARYRRGMDRYRNGTGIGGRFVPPHIIRAQSTGSGTTVNRGVFDALMPVFSDYSVYDNSVDGSPPRLVAASTSQGA